jgi:hypothetical protein
MASVNKCIKLIFSVLCISKKTLVNIDEILVNIDETTVNINGNMANIDGNMVNIDGTMANINEELSASIRLLKMFRQLLLNLLLLLYSHQILMDTAFSISDYHI